MNDAFDVLNSPRVAKVLRRLHAEADRQTPGLLLHYLPKLPRLLRGAALTFSDAQIHNFYADKYIALERDQAAFCYLTACSLGAKTIVEFGTSFGVSTLWLAAAARACGGRVITSELVPEKAEQAKHNLRDAGLDKVVEIRVGDALETLQQLPDEVDMLLNDGFPTLALPILKLVAPRMRVGAVTITDNVGSFKGNYREYLRYLHQPSNGFRSVTLPFKSGTEYSVRAQRQ